MDHGRGLSLSVTESFVDTAQSDDVKSSKYTIYNLKNKSIWPRNLPVNVKTVFVSSVLDS